MPTIERVYNAPNGDLKAELLLRPGVRLRTTVLVTPALRGLQLTPETGPELLDLVSAVLTARRHYVGG